MDFITSSLAYILPFVLVLSVLVFVHEFGHYFVARRFGVRIEVFSIGFGRELFGWNDRAGTRWKFSMIPLGGYVRMFGDADESSRPDVKALDRLSAKDKAETFQFKPLWQRFSIVAAGPVTNFLFAMVVLAALFMSIGRPFTPPHVGAVQEGSAAAEAHILPGDVVRTIGNTSIRRFEQIQQIVAINIGTPIVMSLDRDGKIFDINITPKVVEFEDNFGNLHAKGLLGISSSQAMAVEKMGPVTAVGAAVQEVFSISGDILVTLGQLVVGSRSRSEIGGPLQIAKLSGDFARNGAVSLIWFMALLSVNLGLLNFFPIPLLDGGHLFFYACEAILRRPLSEKAQEIGFRIGFGLVMMLLVFATWNDLVSLRVVEFIKRVSS
ncbi:MAG TPA: RIP metalloprotease RseP [Rhodospirillaceae bacterium]|nr:MAG: RIP metalloprotease RseP [Alphaproteobacteria bacterium GWF2_58_20]HAU28487.1 RIP metalloprotease RseP [Rhodospirillaceae bacterium]